MQVRGIAVSLLSFTRPRREPSPGDAWQLSCREVRARPAIFSRFGDVVGMALSDARTIRWTFHVHRLADRQRLHRHWCLSSMVHRPFDARSSSLGPNASPTPKRGGYTRLQHAGGSLIMADD